MLGDFLWVSQVFKAIARPINYASPLSPRSLKLVAGPEQPFTAGNLPA